MFNKTTIFIIGAGASAECGLPTGSQLKQDIAEGLYFYFEEGRLSKGDEALFRTLREHNPRLSAINTRPLAAAIPTFESIDEALHWWGNNPELVELGKIAIAHYLIAAERKSSLSKQNGSFDLEAASGTWLGAFVSMALSQLKQEAAAKAFENVTIINFNYDRTVEHYLYLSLQQHGGIPAETAKASVERLKIIRPYGSLGQLEWLAPDGVPFGGNESAAEVIAAATNIRTFTEQIEGDNLRRSIDDALDKACVVICLGFGFHRQNLALLTRQDKTNTWRPNLTLISATTKGLHDANYPAIKTFLERDVRFAPPPILNSCSAAQLLQWLRPTIMMAAT
jgi:hypothetical protein